MQNLDTQLFYAINGLAQKSPFWDEVFIFLSKYSIVVFSLVLLYYLIKNRRIFWAALFSIALARLGFVELIRLLYNRPRPFLQTPETKLLIEKEAQEPSFPSGTTAILFSLAFAVYLYDKKIGAILIIAALVLSAARVYVGVHYPSDILGGIAVAALSVYLMKKIKK